MSDTRYRAGSQRQALWTAYSEDGIKAALKAAAKLGMKEQSAKVYISQFEKEAVAPKKEDGYRSKVFDIGDPNNLGTVIKKYDEVSEIRFADGTVRYVPNDKLIPDNFFNEDTKGCYNHAYKFVVMENNKRIDETNLFSKAKRLCAGNKMRFIYAITKAGLVRLIPRSIWSTFPDVPA